MNSLGMQKIIKLYIFFAKHKYSNTIVE